MNSSKHLRSWSLPRQKTKESFPSHFKNPILKKKKKPILRKRRTYIILRTNASQENHWLDSLSNMDTKTLNNIQGNQTQQPVRRVSAWCEQVWFILWVQNGLTSDNERSMPYPYNKTQGLISRYRKANWQTPTAVLQRVSVKTPQLTSPLVTFLPR